MPKVAPEPEEVEETETEVSEEAVTTEEKTEEK